MGFMQTIASSLKVFVALLGTYATWLFGSWDISMTVLVVFLAADFVTGILCAKANKSISSDTGFKGIAKKIVILLILLAAGQLDKLVGGGAVQTAVCYFYIANEGISILENAASLGVPFPKKLRDILLQLRNKSDTEKDQAADESRKDALPEAGASHSEEIPTQPVEVETEEKNPPFVPLDDDQIDFPDLYLDENQFVPPDIKRFTPPDIPRNDNSFDTKVFGDDGQFSSQISFSGKSSGKGSNSNL